MTEPLSRHSKHSHKVPVVAIATVAVVIIATIAMIVIFFLRASSSPSEKMSVPRAPKAVQSFASPTTETPPEPVTFTVAATGDVLSHDWVVKASHRSDGTYDFEPLVANITPYIKGADLPLFHSEVPFGFTEEQHSGYPVFAAPRGWVNSIKKMGYVGASLASNHTWDQGRDGIENTIKLYEENGLGTSGANVTAEQDPIQYYKLHRNNRDIIIAHLSMTYGLNYENIPELNDNPWLTHVNNPEHIIELAKKARSEGKADVVIASMHGGTEYMAQANEQQQQWAKMLADSGVVDLYIGHHVHVPQPLAKIEGGVDGQGMYVFYGTGNLLSSMVPSMGDGTQCGMIAHATITVPGKGPAHVDSVGWTSIILDRGSLQVFPGHGYDQSKYPGAQLSTSAGQQYYQHVVSVAGDVGQEITEPGTPGGDPATVVPRK
ncbi:MAG: CapA family protein [Actinomycetaceae bacterium]|nr:CapA family protein [Actinomycetaceae bacterium]